MVTVILYSVPTLGTLQWSDHDTDSCWKWLSYGFNMLTWSQTWSLLLYQLNWTTARPAVLTLLHSVSFYRPVCVLAKLIASGLLSLMLWPFLYSSGCKISQKWRLSEDQFIQYMRMEIQIKLHFKDILLLMWCFGREYLQYVFLWVK